MIPEPNVDGKRRDERLKSVILAVANEYVQRESNGTSLITLTDVRLADKGGRALLLFTVIPQNKEKAALDFFKRKRGELREYITGKVRMRKVPFLDVAIDGGEHNRQKIDEISRNV